MMTRVDSSLPTPMNGRAGLLTEGFLRTHRVLHEGLASGVAPAIAVGIWSFEGRKLFADAVGHTATVPTLGARVSADTVFDLASLTKPLGTGLLAARLIDRGWIDWNTRVASVLEDFPWPQISVAHLLSHTAGYIAWRGYYEEAVKKWSDGIWRVPIRERKAWMWQRLRGEKPEYGPGERCLYSDVSFLILGYFLEAVTGTSLESAIRENVLNPLRVKSDIFFIPVDRSTDAGRIASIPATEASSWRCPSPWTVQGQVHDENAWVMGGIAGHAGLFGTIQGVSTMVDGIWRNFLSRETRLRVWTATDPTRVPRTMGWDIPTGSESSAGQFFSRNSVGHLGYTGTSLWIDPEMKIAVTVLSNRVHPTRENTLIKAFRPKLYDAVALDWRNR